MLRSSWVGPLTWKRVVYLLKNHVRRVDFVVATSCLGYCTFVGFCREGLPVFDLKIDNYASGRERTLTFLHEISHVCLMVTGYWGKSDWVEKVCERRALEFLERYPRFSEFLLNKILRRTKDDMPVCEITTSAPLRF